MTAPLALALILLAGVADALLLLILRQQWRMGDAADSMARSLVRIAYTPPPAMPHAAEAPGAHPDLHAVAGGRE